MAKKGGLGKGLDALFTENSVEEISGTSAVKLRLSEIEPNKEQPRKTFDEKALSELAQSIERNGILQPLLVRPMPDGSYQLVAGERRWRASRIAGLVEVPVVIREMSDEQAMEIALVENLQREDLNPIEEAEGLKLLIDRYGLTQEDAAVRVGRSRPAVANSLRLLNLPTQVRELAKDGKLSAGHARALLGFSNQDDMIRIAVDAVERDLSVREVERIVKNDGKQGLEKTEKRPARRDVFFDEVEIALSQTLGRKVKVVVGKDSKGVVEFEFFGKDDLTQLAKQLDVE